MQNDSPRVEVMQKGGDALFAVRVTPKASRTAVMSVYGEALKMAVTSPPDKGKANAAVIAALGRGLGIAKTRFTIEAGRSSRTKLIRVREISAAQLSQRMKGILGE